jgi:hypothetical protein
MPVQENSEKIQQNLCVMMFLYSYSIGMWRTKDLVGVNSNVVFICKNLVTRKIINVLKMLLREVANYIQNDIQNLPQFWMKRAFFSSETKIGVVVFFFQRKTAQTCIYLLFTCKFLAIQYIIYCRGANRRNRYTENPPNCMGGNPGV